MFNIVYCAFLFGGETYLPTKNFTNKYMYETYMIRPKVVRYKL